MTDNPFDDLMERAEYCDARGISTRTEERERSLRIGPPFLRVGKKIYYRRQAVREWLLSKEQVQPRATAGRGAT